MKLMIDVPKEIYQNAKTDMLCGSEVIVNAIRNGIPQEPKTEWIPVSKELPTSDEDVLVTNGIGVYVGWIDLTDKIWRVHSESEYLMYDIVAWMLLPKPYEK